MYPSVSVVIFDDRRKLLSVHRARRSFDLYLINIDGTGLE